MTMIHVKLVVIQESFQKFQQPNYTNLDPSIRLLRIFLGQLKKNNGNFQGLTLLSSKPT